MACKGTGCFAGDDARLGTHGASEAGEDLGIDPVDLSKLAGDFHRNLLSEGK